MHDGRRIYLLADGRVLNLAAAEGHPAAVMDMSFANQALSAVYIAAERTTRWRPGVYDVPGDIDREVARLKLDSLGRAHRPAYRRAAALPGVVGHGHMRRYP